MYHKDYCLLALLWQFQLLTRAQLSLHSGSFVFDRAVSSKTKVQAMVKLLSIFLLKVLNPIECPKFNRVHFVDNRIQWNASHTQKEKDKPVKWLYNQLVPWHGTWIIYMKYLPLSAVVVKCIWCLDLKVLLLDSKRNGYGEKLLQRNAIQAILLSRFWCCL